MEEGREEIEGTGPAGIKHARTHTPTPTHMHTPTHTHTCGHAHEH